MPGDAAMDTTNSQGGLTRFDMIRIAAFSLVLFLIVPLSGRTLTGHESVQPQTSREMYRGGDWIVPTVGGDPWLERPPIPSWFICAAYAVADTAESDAVARVAAILVAVPIVLLVAGIGSRLFGRTAGILSGLILASMQEFYAYASNPEADIFLALIVTGVLSVFVRLEFGQRADHAGESTGFIRGRPWLVVAFFALLGATNLAKGVIFGTVMAGLPVAGYLLWNHSWTQIRRYIWLWGWLLALGVALIWPLMVIGRYPEILDLWKSHYVGRLNKGYLQEPWWYYLAYIPQILLPWSIPAVVGLCATCKSSFRGPGPERFLWCWAIIPPLVFSFSDGKHHHYLLQCIAPWAVLSVTGLRLIWQFCREKLPRWSTDPLLAAAIWGAAAAAILIVFRDKIPGGVEAALGIGIFVPVAAFIVARSAIHSNPGTAFASVLAVVAAGFGFWTSYQTNHLDKYADDLVFVREASHVVPDGSPVFLEFDWIAPLETFWMLYHSPRQGVTIRDPWQLAERSAGKECAYILTRRFLVEKLAVVGTATVVLESRYTRNEKDPGERRVLCRVTFKKDIPPPDAEYIRIVRRTLW
jgi:4-amino-4-deoxy-L-arabinose transferase-like glycosyltransferase